MSHFTYGSKQFTSVEQLSPLQKYQIVIYLNFLHEGELTRKHQKQFCCDMRVLKSLQKCKVSDFVNQSQIPQHLSGQDFVFHPHLDTDYHPLDVGPVQEWDSKHVGMHLKWSESDCFKLLLGLFEQAMLTIKQSTVGSKRDAYSEAVAYIQSDLNKKFLQSLGLDHDDFCAQLPDYKIRFDRFNQQRNLARCNVEDFDANDALEEFDEDSEEALVQAECLDESEEADIVDFSSLTSSIF